MSRVSIEVVESIVNGAFIYIHGTPPSEPMGVPMSRGCVRMRLQDICELADDVSPGTLVSIVKPDMLELLIESILSLLEGPLMGIGVSPVAVLRGVELFVIVLLTVFGSYFVRRFIGTLKTRAEKLSLNGTIHFSALQGPARTLVWVVGLTLALERASVGLDIEAILLHCVPL